MGFLMNRDTPLVMCVITQIVLAASSETAVDMLHPRPYVMRFKTTQLNRKAQR